MNLMTRYLGYELRSPLVLSASPLTTEPDNFARLEASGVGAVVLHSLFEEEIQKEKQFIQPQIYQADAYHEASKFSHVLKSHYSRTDEYLDLIRLARDRMSVPVIASLNGATLGGWTTFALRMQDAGASAIELNIYAFMTDAARTCIDVEHTVCNIVESVRRTVSVPLAVKLSPYYNNMSHVARRLDDLGVDALVLFNRFYQPDIDIETLSVQTDIVLSTSYDLRLPLRWVALLYQQVDCDLAATSGIHTAEDVIRVMMAGASVAMMTSAILKRGIGYFSQVREALEQWMAAHGYSTLDELRGAVSQLRSDNPEAFERAQYMLGLKTYTGGA